MNIVLEIWGYLSMIVVIVSMLMNDVKKLRLINSIACAMFIVYGYFHQAYPVVMMNSIVIIINLYHVKKLK